MQKWPGGSLKTSYSVKKMRCYKKLWMTASLRKERGHWPYVDTLHQQNQKCNWSRRYQIQSNLASLVGPRQAQAPQQLIKLRNRIWFPSKSPAKGIKGGRKGIIKLERNLITQAHNRNSTLFTKQKFKQKIQPNQITRAPPNEMTTQ